MSLLQNDNFWEILLELNDETFFEDERHLKSAEQAKRNGQYE